jgi:hypothetical protein
MGLPALFPARTCAFTTVTTEFTGVALLFLAKVTTPFGGTTVFARLETIALLPF